jgi:ribosomal protein S18 acetylase RimI-like enzyme
VIREYRKSEDRPWAEGRLDEAWGGALQARRGALLDVLALPGFVAEEGGRPVGIATYRIDGDECELVFLEAFEPRRGIGTALVEAVVGAARGCRRIRVVTTNDNLDALRFYQRRGFRLVELRAGAVDEARRSLEPSIGLVGEAGIPIRDELELARDVLP